MKKTTETSIYWIKVTKEDTVPMRHHCTEKSQILIDAINEIKAFKGEVISFEFERRINARRFNVVLNNSALRREILGKCFLRKNKVFFRKEAFNDEK